jgi:S-adenosylmethionine:tRNA ribosyltransferase-isomerase
MMTFTEHDILGAEPLDFALPPELEAHEPPEARGLTRDGVRLMVSHYGSDRIAHARFSEIGDFLHEGDVLVLNTSKTLPAALLARQEDGAPVELHLSTRLPAQLWIVEPRVLDGNGSHPFAPVHPGERLTLPDNAGVTLHTPYRPDEQTILDGPARLWIASLDLPQPLEIYLARNGFPIRYHYAPGAWPLSAYQTVYADEAGSAEMPSAGRAFTQVLLRGLERQGVEITRLVLHTGVSSQEAHEPPYEEWYRVPLATAKAVSSARWDGRRVIAVGTTVVRALETVTDEEGLTHPGEGWTRLVITPKRGIRAVDGLLTGLHEPRASHLAMLEALAGREHLRLTYAQALDHRYLWHEFGDTHVLLP